MAWGAGNQKETEETIHSSFLICLVTGLLICVVGLTSSRAFLVLLHTKDELMEGAVNYLQIYSLGMPAMGLYNFGNGVMSSEVTPTAAGVSAYRGVLNVIMNLIFVIGLHMAAEGVAIASVMAQYTSAGLVLHHLWRRRDVCRLQLRKVCFHRMAGKAVLMLGIPGGGLQQAIFAIANLFVQAGSQFL